MRRATVTRAQCHRVSGLRRTWVGLACDVRAKEMGRGHLSGGGLWHDVGYQTEKGKQRIPAEIAY